MKKSHKRIKRNHKSKRNHIIKRHHKIKHNNKTKHNRKTKRLHRRGRTAGGPKTYNKEDKIRQLMDRDPTLDYETATAAAEHFAPTRRLSRNEWHAATKKHLDR